MVTHMFSELFWGWGKGAQTHTRANPWIHANDVKTYPEGVYSLSGGPLGEKHNERQSSTTSQILFFQVVLNLSMREETTTRI